MAEQGMGIAYLPDFAIGRQLREGVLVTVLNDYTDHSGPLRILWPSSRHLAPKLRAFVDFLAANLIPAVAGQANGPEEPQGTAATLRNSERGGSVVGGAPAI
jgi:hypothetical protein